jgi:hypothetical protein
LIATGNAGHGSVKDVRSVPRGRVQLRGQQPRRGGQAVMFDRWCHCSRAVAEELLDFLLDLDNHTLTSTIAATMSSPFR